MKIIALIGILIAIASSAQAAETITVKEVNGYLSTRHFEYSGSGPYLSYFNGERNISIDAFARAKKFKAENTILKVSTDAKEPIKQIDFKSTICNPEGTRGMMDLMPEHISLKDEKKEVLQKEVIKAAKTLFNVSLSKENIASIKEGKTLDTAAFVLAYNEYPAKCDTNGGGSVYYKIFVKDSY